MKNKSFKKISGGALTLMLGAAMAVHAQQRYGGGGGGFGGFGGFGGGGGGFGGGNRGGTGTTGSSQYNNNGTVGSAVIQVDPTTHNLIIIADKQTRDQIQQVIDNLDQPEPQVLIKVVFLEVQHNNASEIGVQGSYTGGSLGSGLAAVTGLVTNYTVAGTGSGATIVPSSITPTYQSFNMANGFNLPQAVSGAAGNGGLYQVLGNDFTATIQAVAAAGKSQVLSRPSVLARDGQMAQIVVGQEVYLPSGVSYTSVGNSTATIPTINGSYQNVGIILNVTPFIGANNLIQMILEPQTSELDTSSPGQVITYGSSLVSSTPVYAPNVNIRSANTVVITPDTQTVVIGGLISNSKSTSDTKVPFLGDIPLLGALFKSTAKADSKTELLMFLTPHIVKAPTQLTNISTTELNGAMLITNSVSEQELDRFLEHVPVKPSK